jgi:Fungal N-terminal domain of STAND proteins
MIDPFTLGTSIVGIVSLAIQVAQVTTTYVSDVQSAQTEINSLALQLSALSDVLQKLQELLRSGSIDGTFFQPGSGLCLVLQSCQKQLESLYKKLDRKNDKGRTKVSASIQRLKWPLEKKESVEATRRLYEWSQTFHFCLTIANW